MATDILQKDHIFNIAAEIRDLAARALYLDDVCRGNDDLRREIEELLAHDQQASRFLEPPVLPVAIDDELPVNEPLVECPSTIIGPYRLMEQIGEGGFGVVFMAMQERPVRRKVALKIIKPGMDTRQVIARFEAERQALAMMDHPSIAKVFDAGATETGRPYFVMELVQGIPITEYCDQCNLTTRERLELFITVCQAVQHAHQKGVIHRDIKPTNVLVAMQDGMPTPKIIDFGVAKAIGQRLTDHTLTMGFAQIVGTPLYMSPEQAELSPLGVDTRSDIYSLGVLLYELLTGTTPFDKERMHAVPYDELRRIIREEEPRRPSARLSSLFGSLPLAGRVREGVTAAETAARATTLAERRRTDPRRLVQTVRGELDWIVMKCLDKDRNRRYESANALARDIGRHLADEAVQACPPSAAYRLQKFARRNRGPVLAASLVLLTLVVGIVGTTLGMVRATHAQMAAADEARKKEAALKAAQQSQRDAQDQLFSALWSQARAGRFSRQMGQRLGSLAAIEKAAAIRSDERLRDEAIAAMALPDLRRVPVWRPAPLGTTAMTYGGLGRLYARVDEQWNMSFRQISDDRLVQRVAAGPLMTTNRFEFSSDDEFVIALTAQNALRVWRAADGRTVLEDEPCDYGAYDFAPDGRRLAIGQHQAVVYLDLSTGEEILRWRLSGAAHSLDFSAEGDRLAVGYYNSDVASVYDAATGNLVTDLAVGAMNSQIVAWHPNTENLAVTGSDPRIQFWNVSAKQRVAMLEGHKQNVTKLMFQPTGELLASHSWDGTLRIWEPSTERQLLQLHFTSPNERPQSSRDGRWIWAKLHSEQAELLEVIPSREFRTLVSSSGGGVGGYKYADISPDGRLLIVGMEQGASVWDLEDGRELARLPDGTIYVFFDRSELDESERSSNAKSADRPQQFESSIPDSRSYVLLTSGSAGLLRWPISSDTQGRQLRLGQPKELSPLPQAWFARSPDGRAIGVVMQEGGPNKIIDLETGTVQRELGPHTNGHVRALSSDGRWAASSGWHSNRVRLWNALTGEKVYDWLLGKQSLVQFTPDSRTIVISRGDEFSFWDVETLQPIRRLPRESGLHPGHVAFSADGKLMALELAPAVIHLKDSATFRTIAKLEDPHGDRSTWLGFTPDGTRLVVVTSNATAIHVWDLRAIRARLKEMNLDWDWPEFAPANPIPGSEPEKYTVEVALGDPEKG